MTPEELDVQVAKATGETLSEIRRRGFSVADAVEVNFDPEPDAARPQMIDWDELDHQRLRD